MRQGFELGIQWVYAYVLTIWRAIGSRSASWINLPTRRPEHPGYSVGLLLKKSSKMYHVWVLSNSTASSHGWFPERKAFFIVGPGSLSNDNFTLGLALGRRAMPHHMLSFWAMPSPYRWRLAFTPPMVLSHLLCSPLLGSLSFVILTTPYCVG